MGSEKIAFIINPKSGSKSKENVEDIIHQHFDPKKFKITIFRTRYPGHGNSLAYEAAKQGFKKIIAVGGDGTVNEIAAALVNVDAALGIVPCGSGNGLARHLGIPINIVKSIELLSDCKVKKIDGGKLNDYWFFCTCGVGFDAKIGRKFAKTEKRGFLSYTKLVINEFKAYKPKKYRFSVDGEDYIRKAFLITIANATQYGNNAHIAPNALIDDGLFDVCIIKPFPLIKAPFLGMRLFNRSLEESRYHEIIRGRQIKFKKPKKKYIFHYDGEPTRFKKEKIIISMYPKALRVLVPKKK